MSDVAPPAELAPLLSAERLSTYRRYAPEWGLAPLSLYVLGGRLASSYHHDLGVAEVVLRNALNDQLAAQYGARWWADEALLDERGQAAVAKAYSDARCREDSPPGRLIAQLPMGFWVHLLEPGGYASRKPFRQRRYYDALLWRPALRHAFPQSTGIRGDVHAVAHRVYALRNRIAHCEAVIGGVRIPGSQHRRGPAEIHQDILTLVSWISAPVGAWLAAQSRTPEILDHARPGV